MLGFHVYKASDHLRSVLILSIYQVTDLCMQMKEHMYRVCEENSDKMQVNLQELQEVLESCNKFSHELLEANSALACLREGDMP